MLVSPQVFNCSNTLRRETAEPVLEVLLNFVEFREFMFSHHFYHVTS